MPRPRLVVNDGLVPVQGVIHLENKIGVLISIVILVVIAAVLFPIVNTQVQDLTNASSENYVGASVDDIVELVPLFYWLLVSLVTIGAAIAAFRGTDSTG